LGTTLREVANLVRDDGKPSGNGRRQPCRDFR
jgi:hypothetical protein